MTDYTPIDCGLHSEYEVAILHRRKLRMSWRSEQGDQVQVLLPKDLQTRNGEEFLIAEAADGELLRLRLDRITHAEPL